MLPLERNSYSTLFFKSLLTIRLLGALFAEKRIYFFGQENWFDSYLGSATTFQINFKGNKCLQEQQQSSVVME